MNTTFDLQSSIYLSLCPYLPVDGSAAALVEYFEGIHRIVVGIDVSHYDGDKICLNVENLEFKLLAHSV